MTDKAPVAWQLELAARAINATDWQPLPGMVKRRCGWCHYWFPCRSLRRKQRHVDRTARALAPPVRGAIATALMFLAIGSASAADAPCPPGPAPHSDQAGSFCKLTQSPTRASQCSLNAALTGIARADAIAASQATRHNIGDRRCLRSWRAPSCDSSIPVATFSIGSGSMLPTLTPGSARLRHVLSPCDGYGCHHAKHGGGAIS